MAKELIINASLPEIRIALMEDGQIQELLIERDSDKGIVGNIYKGRVTRVLPGMQAAFVDIGLEKAAFLYVDDIYVHPKVMGDENEVSTDESDADRDSNDGGSDGADAPIRAFNAEASDEIVTEPAHEHEHVATAAEVASESADSSMLESHASEHFERDEEALEAEEDTNPMMQAPTRDELEYDEESDEDFEDEEEGDDESDGSELEAAPLDDASATTAAVTEGTEGAAAPLAGLAQDQRPPRKGRNRRRGRRGRSGKEEGNRNQFAGGETGGDRGGDRSGEIDPHMIPESINESLDDQGQVVSDRAQMEGESKTGIGAKTRSPKPQRPEFREARARDRRIKTKHSRPRAPASISDLLKEGQEVVVQVAKDPIATKGARLTCHVSLPGRHLVCMPTIDHVGVSRRIERDDERRRLRDFVERNRPRKMGFIVRTASGGKDPESWIKTDIDYLSKLWKEIRVKTDEVSAPAMVYEDLNSILRAIRDWVNEDIDRIIVDSRYYYNELMAFSERFMPQLAEIIELYQGDIPIFDAYGISGELHRSLERRVWLKSGGYIVIDQAEALVAIDVNTGRFVGKKSLEDTILKTNLEAAEEIAYQLRLRNCGGIIICDFIDMERDDNRMRVYRALDEALKRDRARPTIQKISDLGLVEMTRKRTRDTIIRTLCEPCTHCEGKGFSKSTRTVAYEILREMERLSVDREAKKILVSAHESVIDILAIDLREVVDQLERRYNKTVFLQAVMDYHGEQFEVVTDRMSGKKPTGDIARQLRSERERTERKEKTRQRQKEDSGSERESVQDRGGRDRNEGRNEERSGGNERSGRGGERKSFGRDRNESRNEGRNENRNERGAESRNERVEIADTAPSVPKPTPFKINPRPAVQAQTVGGPTESDHTTEDRQPDFDQIESGPAYHAPQSAPDFSGIEDEDQLAYLRAQAAQDAALANLNSNSPNLHNGRGQGQGQGRGRQQQNNRNQPGGRNQNNRGGQAGGGRNQNQRGAQAGQRFRPGRGPQGGVPMGQGGGMIQPRSAPLAAQAPAPQPQASYLEPQVEPQIPDYEVLVKPEGGDSNS